MERIEITGLPFLSTTVEGAADYAMEFIRSGKGGVIVTPNAEIAKLAMEDKEFCQLLCAADMVVPDGAGVVLASKILKKPLAGKVAGIELGMALMPRLAAEGKKLFLLGSKPGVAEAAAEKIKELAPTIEICGMHDGYFKEDGPIIEEIRQSGASALLCCLGAPKQEKWMVEHKNDLPGVLMLGLGGTLDVLAGNVKRAPEFFIRFNLEWFYRLLKEPKRIGRMMKLPAYIGEVMLIRVGTKKEK